MNGYAPFTGFGDDLATSIRFRILRPGGRLPDWTGGPRLRQKTIPGSSRVNIRRMGRDPYTVQFRLRLDSHAAYAALEAAQGQVATLRYPWGETTSVGGHFELIRDRAYLVIPGVRLMAPLEDPVIDAEFIEVTATFLKPFGEVS